MKVWINVLGAMLIAAIGFLTLRSMQSGSNKPRPSNESLRQDLLMAASSSDQFQIGRIDFLDKTILVSASTTVISSDRVAEEKIGVNLARHGWRQMETPLVRTYIHCKEPVVIKIVGPTALSENSFRYYLEASWGNFASYCKRRS